MAKIKSISFTAGLVLAATLTFSCGQHDDGNEQASCPLSAVSDNSVTCGGQTYRTVKIGEQVWFAENLNYKVKGSSCYGEIGKVITEEYDAGSNTFIAKTLPPEEVQANCLKYGLLYDWATAMRLEHPKCNRVGNCPVNAKHQGICPEGWHIPSREEWEELLEAVGGYRTAGARLRATTDWDYCVFLDHDASLRCEDTYGFSALPGGYGYSESNYRWGGMYAYWWSTYNGNNGLTYACHIDDLNPHVFCETDAKSSLFSVRCLKD